MRRERSIAFNPLLEIPPGSSEGASAQKLTPSFNPLLEIRREVLYAACD